jgi:hypothetical protein
VKDDGKTHANGDHGDADQSKVKCAIVNGKGEDVSDGLHDVFYLSYVLRGTGSNIISRGEDFSIDAGFAIPALVQLADWIE